MSEKEKILGWLLERYRLGELDEDEMAALGRRIEADDDARRRLESLRASEEELAKRHPASGMVAAIRNRNAAEEEAARLSKSSSSDTARGSKA